MFLFEKADTRVHTGDRLLNETIGNLLFTLMFLSKLLC